MDKMHAKDYLIEYANSLNGKDWLKCLVFEAINTNGNISEERMNAIYSNLIDGTDITVPNIESRTIQSESILLSSLKHISGVNALKNNQTIKFNNNVTILHGMNGAGKSSYFRILNEITGGNKQKSITQNIYSDSLLPINVEIKYKDGKSNDKTINWNGTSRALDQLNNCSVFDSSYLESFLNVRTVNEAVLQPLGLGLFSYISSRIDELKSRIQESSQKVRMEKPNIDFTNISDEIRNAILNNSLTLEIRKKIEACYSFSLEEYRQLGCIRDELLNLKQTNIADRIALLSKTKKSYENFSNSLKRTCKLLSDAVESVKNIVKDYQNKKNLNEKAKKQFEVFNSIPGSESNEWKQFVVAGHKYLSIIGENDVCPYCGQSLLTEKSKSLLRAYALFLSDKTENELNIARQNLNVKNKEIEIINTNIVIDEDVEKLFSNVYIGSIAAIQYIKDSIVYLNSIKDNLINQINTGIIDEIDVDITRVENFTNKLDSECIRLNKELELLSKNSDEREVKITTLELKIKNSVEKLAISKQVDLFRMWFEKDDIEKKLSIIEKKISTTDITRISNYANDNLLTENLRNKFIEELDALDKKDLRVNLIKLKGVKGKQSTQLVLTRNNDVKVVLSEGEQKAIGLALFIAEIRSSQSCNPIILDDPVNSLDHQIAGKFAERLLQLKNQIIIFNHNVLFLNAFEASKGNHICKSGNADCNNHNGKHIKVYLIQDEGQSAKGVVCDYKHNKASDHIRDANKLLDISPFEEHVKVSTLIRKAVECCIDEVIFNNLTPTRYSTKHSRINWDELKKMVTDSNTIDKLRNIHDRVSGGIIHNGSESNENPIKVDELRQFVKDINDIIML